MACFCLATQLFVTETNLGYWSTTKKKGQKNSKEGGDVWLGNMQLNTQVMIRRRMQGEGC